MFERVHPDKGFVKARGCLGTVFRGCSNWFSAFLYALMLATWMFLLVGNASVEVQRGLFITAISCQVLALFLRSPGGLQSLTPEAGRLTFSQPCFNDVHEHIPRTPNAYAFAFRTMADALLLPLGYFAFEWSSTAAILLGQCIVFVVPTTSHDGIMWGSVTVGIFIVLVVHVVAGCVLTALPLFRGSTKTLLLMGISLLYLPVVRIGAHTVLCVSTTSSTSVPIGPWVEPLGPSCHSSSHAGAIAVVMLSLLVALLTEHMQQSSICCLEQQEGAKSGESAEYGRSRGNERRVHPLWLEWSFVTRTAVALVLVCSFTERSAVRAFGTTLVGACIVFFVDFFTYIMLKLKLLRVSNVLPLEELVWDSCLVRLVSSSALVALCIVQDMDVSSSYQCQYILAGCWLGSLCGCIAVQWWKRRGEGSLLEPKDMMDPLAGIDRDSALSF